VTALNPLLCGTIPIHALYWSSRLSEPHTQGSLYSIFSNSVCSSPSFLAFSSWYALSSFFLILLQGLHLSALDMLLQHKKTESLGEDIVRDEPREAPQEPEEVGHGAIINVAGR